MDRSVALAKAAALCSKQERCVNEIMEKFRKWGVEKTDMSELIDYLVDEKYIDEQRFAIAYVKDKYRFNRWGRIKIRYQLKMKAIASDVIDNAFEEISENEYEQNLLDLLQSKNAQIKNKDDYQRKATLIRYAAGRGFEPDLIYSKIEDVLV